MNIFEIIRKLFSKDKIENKVQNSFDISSTEKIQNIVSASKNKKQFIYKHSTRCATSFFALQNIKSLELVKRNNIEFYLVDVIAQKEISNSIAKIFKVKHESPQVLILESGEVIWHGSHQMISVENLEKFL